MSGITPWNIAKKVGIDHSFLPIDDLNVVQFARVMAKASIESATPTITTSKMFIIVNYYKGNILLLSIKNAIIIKDDKNN